MAGPFVSIGDEALAEEQMSWDAPDAVFVRQSSPRRLRERQIAASQVGVGHPGDVVSHDSGEAIPLDAG